MPTPLRLSIWRRSQVVIGIVTAGLVVGSFQLGRQSVDASALSEPTTATARATPASDLSPRSDALAPREHKPRNIREIATVPFSEIYGVLRGATRGQLLAWAVDLATAAMNLLLRPLLAAAFVVLNYDAKARSGKVNREVISLE